MERRRRQQQQSALRQEQAPLCLAPVLPTVSSRNTSSSDKPPLPASTTISELETPTLADLQKEEERLRVDEESAVHRKRHDAQQLAVKRGLAPDHSASSTPRRSPSPVQAPMATVESTVSPLIRTPASEPEHHLHESIPFPSFVDAQTMPDSSAFYVDESDYSSKAVTPNRPLSLRAEAREEGERGEGFVPARLPNFGGG